MNPLSALRTLAYPALRADPIRPPAETAAPTPIPFTELEKISPGIQPLSVGVPPSGTFAQTLGGLVGEVSAKQAVANDAVKGLLAGQNVSLHQTMIAMEEASVSFQLMVEVRNRMLESYQELMRMQI